MSPKNKKIYRKYSTTSQQNSNTKKNETKKFKQLLHKKYKTTSLNKKL